MTFPRFLLLILIAALALPWLSLEVVRATTPIAAAFEERTDARRYVLRTPNFRYWAPTDIGRTRSVSLPMFGLAGPQTTRLYHSLGPTSGPERPAIVLLHGAGRSGRAMLDMWRGLAEKEDLVLLAPDAARSRGWSLAEDGVFVAEALIEDASRHHPIDPERIYLVGHSMGGKMALRLANLGYGPWRAVEAHAASLWVNTILPARSPVPIQIHVGERDTIFSPDAARATGKRLSEAGHDVKFTVIPGHTHWYYAIAPHLAPVIWQTFTEAEAPV
ncbi:hypothetical protein DDZ14_12725 [Maritimibacter sp. 55A14]|uniref:alpha/beta fold hydrolase n=1 Tax=Maritimibacter sp. 55A14 TaxID=2174844 RepID=UPI000D61EDA0|nr:alpha/beta fold hydrolase [Maritimibacter sp. 55A14]PWE32068.1 hypothetical protein DDZ14_12725 [Maritimibacter sp. 55A14]